MSAPDTDVEKQTKRHKPSLLGIAVAVVFALGLLWLLIATVVNRGGTPEGAEVQIDGRTGAEEVVTD